LKKKIQSLFLGAKITTKTVPTKSALNNGNNQDLRVLPASFETFTKERLIS